MTAALKQARDRQTATIVTLTTDRLLLRPFRATDIDDYARMCADPEVMRYLGEGRPLSRGDAWRQMAMLVGHWHLKGYGMWAIEERDGGRLIGRIGCHYPEGWPGFEVGWALARECWGRGYALEGARAALDHAFTALAQEHVISLIHPANERSIRLAKRLGERAEGTAEVHGQPVLVYGIHRDGWRAVPRARERSDP